MEKAEEAVSAAQSDYSPTWSEVLAELNGVRCELGDMRREMNAGFLDLRGAADERVESEKRDREKADNLLRDEIGRVRGLYNRLVWAFATGSVALVIELLFTFVIKR